VFEKIRRMSAKEMRTEGMPGIWSPLPVLRERVRVRA
jgi:hypothetical protein